MSDHTPGPWKWDAGAATCAEQVENMYEYEGEKFLDVGLRGEDGKEVIPLRIDHHSLEYDGDWISDADRRLIAAAPEMLALCEKFIKRSPCDGCIDVEDAECAEDALCHSRDDYRRVRALVARVRGEEAADV